MPGSSYAIRRRGTDRWDGRLAGVGAVAAAGLVATAFIGDAVGHVAWPWLSDAVGRRAVLAAIFLVQAGLFAGLSLVTSAGVFAVLGALILFC